MLNSGLLRKQSKWWMSRVFSFFLSFVYHLFIMFLSFLSFFDSFFHVPLFPWNMKENWFKKNDKKRIKNDKFWAASEKIKTGECLVFSFFNQFFNHFVCFSYLLPIFLQFCGKTHEFWSENRKTNGKLWKTEGFLHFQLCFFKKNTRISWKTKENEGNLKKW